jgi:hypothetical protein
MTKKKRFVKKVEWIEGNLIERLVYILWIIYAPSIIVALWYPPSFIPKLLISINLCLFFIHSLCFQEPFLVFGKRRIYYEEETP